MKKIAKNFLRRRLSKRTMSLLAFDVIRFKASFGAKTKIRPKERMLHLGCGNRRFSDFLNIDIVGGDETVDIALGKLPLPTDHFDCVVSQHVVEHLQMTEELEPLLEEVFRTMAPKGVLHVSTPDMEIICRMYAEGKVSELVADRKSRKPYAYDAYPDSEIMNQLFHQDGQHKNLFDFDLLSFLLAKAGFTNIERSSEERMMDEVGSFVKREDSLTSLYLRCEKP